nr:RNA polymerase subunit sigma-70 [Actinacidiphila yeochonensis]
MEQHLEAHRTELTGYCHRMLGSVFEAEDAVQETMVRAWRAAEGFEGRSSLRSWLYRIATNVCLDSLSAGRRRARPMDLSPASGADAVLPGRPADDGWAGRVEPLPDERGPESGGDPADVVVARESIRLAFVAALQHLPPKQRAVLILREVLAWRAAETAKLLGTTVPSVNSALQRARATLAASGAAAGTRQGSPTAAAAGLDEGRQALLDRYVDAFERYDLDLLTSLLHEDATLAVPPRARWSRGRERIRGRREASAAGARGRRPSPRAAGPVSPSPAAYEGGRAAPGPAVPPRPRRRFGDADSAAPPSCIRGHLAASLRPPGARATARPTRRPEVRRSRARRPTDPACLERPASPEHPAAAGTELTSHHGGFSSTAAARHGAARTTSHQSVIGRVRESRAVTREGACSRRVSAVCRGSWGDDVALGWDYGASPRAHPVPGAYAATRVERRTTATEDGGGTAARGSARRRVGSGSRPTATDVRWFGPPVRTGPPACRDGRQMRAGAGGA